MSRKVLRFGRALKKDLSTNPVITDGLIVVDETTKKIARGDGVTQGGIAIDGKVWEVGTLEEANSKRLTSGDYLLVNNEKFWAVGDNDYTEVELLTEEQMTQEEQDSASYPAIDWEPLELTNGWVKSTSATNDARIRKDADFVTLDAVLTKYKSSDWSPFRLPVWARPDRILYLLVEMSTGGSGSTPIVIYPDGYVYPRKIYTKSVSRVSFQISYAVN